MQIPKSSNIDALRVSFNSAPKSLVCCPICAGNETSLLTDMDRHDLGINSVVCRRCGMGMISPQPESSWFDEFYRNNYWPIYISSRFKDLDEMFIEDRCAERAGQIFTAIAPNLRKLPESYLDVGCGQGAMLVEFRRRFPASQCKGLEPSPDAVDYCRRHHGIEVEVLNWNSLDGDMITGPFDLITLVHVLEHVLDPVGVLTRAAQRLSPEGMIYVEVPDLLSDRWAGKGFFHIAHIWYFHETSLRNLFQRCGLEVIAITRGVADIWPWAIGFVGRKSVSGPLAPQDVSEVTAEFVPQLVNHLRSRDISPPSKILLLAKKLLRLVYRGAP